MDLKDQEALKAAVEASGQFRLLRRVPAVPPLDIDDGSGKLTVAVVDVETTGLDADVDRIIELAVRRIRVTESGRLLEVGEQRSWLEDPGRPLVEEVAKLTGLTDEDLSGRTIDKRMAAAVLRSSDLVVAHNASFDRPFVERCLPQAAGLAWACTCNDMDWSSLGFEGRSLSHLLFQMGMFFEGHRASADVAALTSMLFHRLDDGRSVLEVLLANARRSTVRVDAIGAPFEASRALRARGYRWDARRRCWQREIEEESLEAEDDWLAGVVYGAGGAPARVRITWRERHG